MKTLVFLKTHFINDFVFGELEKLRVCDDEDHKTVLFIDNHTKFLKIQGNGVKHLIFNEKEQESFILDENLFNETGLPYYAKGSNNADFSEVMWWCCDYPFYIIRKYYPDYDYYWQIESDVFMNGNSYEPFFDRNNNDNDLIGRLFKTVPDIFTPKGNILYKWAYVPEVQRYNCLFPVVRLSGKAIDFLCQRRIEQSKIFEKIKDSGDYFWVYCESFVANELIPNGFKYADLEEKFIHSASLLTPDNKVPVDTPDFNLYHPVKSKINIT